MKHLFAMVLAATALLAGCGDSEFPRLSDADDRPADEVVIKRIRDVEDQVYLTLTQEAVFIELSAQTLDEVRADLDEEREQSWGSKAGDSIKNTVLNQLERLAQKRVEYPVDSIDRISWQNGEITLTHRDAPGATHLSIGEDELQGFSEEDALDFIQAFEELRAARD